MRTPGVRYFSGTATYRTSFDVPADMLAPAVDAGTWTWAGSR